MPITNATIVAITNNTKWKDALPKKPVNRPTTIVKIENTTYHDFTNATTLSKENFGQPYFPVYSNLTWHVWTESLIQLICYWSASLSQLIYITNDIYCVLSVGHWIGGLTRYSILIPSTYPSYIISVLLTVVSASRH